MFIEHQIIILEQGWTGDKIWPWTNPTHPAHELNKFQMWE